jgi:hypothetical protein
MYHAWEEREMHKKFQSENLNGRDQLEDLDINGRKLSDSMLLLT